MKGQYIIKLQQEAVWNLSPALFHSVNLMCVGRDEEKVTIIEAYLKAVKLFRDYSNPSQDPEYSEVKAMRWSMGDSLIVQIWYFLAEVF